MEPGNKMAMQKLSIHGTGEPMPKDCGRYVGTVVQNPTGLVWHLFHDA